MKRFAFALGVTSCLVDVSLVYAKESIIEERRLIPLNLARGPRKEDPLSIFFTKDSSRIPFAQPEVRQNLRSSQFFKPRPTSGVLQSILKLKPRRPAFARYQDRALEKHKRVSLQSTTSLKKLLSAFQPLPSVKTTSTNTLKPPSRAITIPTALNTPTLTRPHKEPTFNFVSLQAHSLKKTTPAPTQPSVSLKELILALARPLPSALLTQPEPAQSSVSFNELVLALKRPLPSALLTKSEPKKSVSVNQHTSPRVVASESVGVSENKSVLSPESRSTYSSETSASLPSKRSVLRKSEQGWNLDSAILKADSVERASLILSPIQNVVSISESSSPLSSHVSNLSAEKRALNLIGKGDEPLSSVVAATLSNDLPHKEHARSLHETPHVLLEKKPELNPSVGDESSEHGHLLGESNLDFVRTTQLIETKPTISRDSIHRKDGSKIITVTPQGESELVASKSGVIARLQQEVDHRPLPLPVQLSSQINHDEVGETEETASSLTKSAIIILADSLREGVPHSVAQQHAIPESLVDHNPVRQPSAEDENFERDQEAALIHSIFESSDVLVERVTSVGTETLNPHLPRGNSRSRAVLRTRLEVPHSSTLNVTIPRALFSQLTQITGVKKRSRLPLEGTLLTPPILVQNNDLGLIPMQPRALGVRPSQRNLGSSMSFMVNLDDLGIRFFGAPRGATLSVDLNSLRRMSRGTPLLLGSTASMPLVLSSGRLTTHQEIYTFDVTLAAPHVQPQTVTLSLDSDSFKELASLVNGPLPLDFMGSTHRNALVPQNLVQPQQPLPLVRRLFAVLERTMMDEPSLMPMTATNQKFMALSVSRITRALQSLRELGQASASKTYVVPPLHPHNQIAYEEVEALKTSPVISLNRFGEGAPHSMAQRYDIIPDILRAVKDLSQIRAPQVSLQEPALTSPVLAHNHDLGLVPMKSRALRGRPSSSSMRLTLDLAALGIRFAPQGATLSVDLNSLRRTNRGTPLLLGSTASMPLVFSSGRLTTHQEIYTFDVTLAAPHVQPQTVTLSLDSDSFKEFASLVSGPLPLDFMGSTHRNALVPQNLVQPQQPLPLVRRLFAVLERTMMNTSSVTGLPVNALNQRLQQSRFVQAFKAPLQLLKAPMQASSLETQSSLPLPQHAFSLSEILQSLGLKLTIPRSLGHFEERSAPEQQEQESASSRVMPINMNPLLPLPEALPLVEEDDSPFAIRTLSFDSPSVQAKFSTLLRERLERSQHSSPPLTPLYSQRRSVSPTDTNTGSSILSASFEERRELPVRQQQQHTLPRPVIHTSEGLGSPLFPESPKTPVHNSLNGSPHTPVNSSPLLKGSPQTPQRVAQRDDSPLLDSSPKTPQQASQPVVDSSLQALLSQLGLQQALVEPLVLQQQRTPSRDVSLSLGSPLLEGSPKTPLNGSPLLEGSPQTPQQASQLVVDGGLQAPLSQPVQQVLITQTSEPLVLQQQRTPSREVSLSLGSPLLEGSPRTPQRVSEIVVDSSLQAPVSQLGLQQVLVTQTSEPLVLQQQRTPSRNVQSLGSPLLDSSPKTPQQASQLVVDGSLQAPVSLLGLQQALGTNTSEQPVLQQQVAQSLGSPLLEGSPRTPLIGSPLLEGSPKTPLNGSPLFEGSPRTPLNGSPLFPGSPKTPQQASQLVVDSPLLEGSPETPRGSPKRATPKSKPKPRSQPLQRQVRSPLTSTTRFDNQQLQAPKSSASVKGGGPKMTQESKESVTVKGDVPVNK